jgi:hypothetical protein
MRNPYQHCEHCLVSGAIGSFRFTDDQHSLQHSLKPSIECAMPDNQAHDSRRRFLKAAGKFAAVTPPTVTLLLAAEGRNYVYAGSGNPGNGNPGNNKNVGNAGESPNGQDFGNGVRGKSQ